MPGSNRPAPLSRRTDFGPAPGPGTKTRTCRQLFQGGFERHLRRTPARDRHRATGRSRSYTPAFTLRAGWDRRSSAALTARRMAGSLLRAELKTLASSPGPALTIGGLRQMLQAEAARASPVRSSHDKARKFSRVAASRDFLQSSHKVLPCVSRRRRSGREQTASQA